MADKTNRIRNGFTPLYGVGSYKGSFDTNAEAKVTKAPTRESENGTNSGGYAGKIPYSGNTYGGRSKPDSD